MYNYTMKRREKASVHNRAGLPQPDPLALCLYLGGTRNHKRGRPAFYLLAHVRHSMSYYTSQLGDHSTRKRIALAIN